MLVGVVQMTSTDDLAGNLRQSRRAAPRGPEAGKITSRRLGPGLEDRLGHGKIPRGIPQELEPLPRGGCLGSEGRAKHAQGKGEERRILEPVRQGILEGDQGSLDVGHVGLGSLRAIRHPATRNVCQAQG